MRARSSSKFWLRTRLDVSYRLSLKACPVYNTANHSQLYGVPQGRTAGPHFFPPLLKRNVCHSFSSHFLSIKWRTCREEAIFFLSSSYPSESAIDTKAIRLFHFLPMQMKFARCHHVYLPSWRKIATCSVVVFLHINKIKKKNYILQVTKN